MQPAQCIAMPITEMLCLANWGSLLPWSSLFSATIKHGVLSKASHLSVKVAYSCLARQKAASKLRMAVHLALLLILLRVSNASPQAPPPPPGRSSDTLSSIGLLLIQTINATLREQQLLISTVLSARPSIVRPSDHPWSKVLKSFFFFNLFQLFQGITVSQLPQRPPGCMTRTALQTHLLLDWASGSRYR